MLGRTNLSNESPCAWTDNVHDAWDVPYHNQTIDIPPSDTLNNRHAHTLLPSECGLTWDGRRNQWVSIVYRYTFPSGSFATDNTNVQSCRSSKVDPIERHYGRSWPDLPSKGSSFSFSESQRHAVLLSSCHKDPFTEGEDDANYFFSEKENFSNNCAALDSQPCLYDQDVSSSCILEEWSNLFSGSVDMQPIDCDKFDDYHRGCDDDSLKPHPKRPRQAIADLTNDYDPFSSWSALLSSCPSSPPPPLFHDGVRPIPEL